MTASSAHQIDWQSEFDEIRCYRDHEIHGILTKLSANQQFIDLMRDLLSSTNGEQFGVQEELKLLTEMTSVAQFQRWIERRITPIIAQGYERLTVSGIDNIDLKDAHIFISNHRDIVMDPLLLNSVLMSLGAATANCAIGDNLMAHPIANDLAKLNRCFKVIRSIKSPKAILQAMKIQSAYIHQLHFGTRENIWIAQKEGRSKDNKDRTNPALIKMLGLAKPKEESMDSYLNRLSIVPVSFSYEWDPCDIDKARELETQSATHDYTKHELEDLIAIRKGLAGYKGKIGIHFDQVLSGTDEQPLTHNLIAEKIDQSIRRNYTLFPVNFVAHKKLNRTPLAHCQFSKHELNSANKELSRRLQDQPDAIKQRVLAAYAEALAWKGAGPLNFG